jgi:hypothetical protein
VAATAAVGWVVQPGSVGIPAFEVRPYRIILDDFWRAKLEEARRRYSDNPTAETRSECARLLRVFADFVLRGQLPPPLE